MALTAKQKAFAEHFLQCRNATEAARRAGYGGNDVTLRAIGYENLTKPHIAEYVAERQRAMVMDANAALARLSEQIDGPDFEALALVFLVYETTEDPKRRFPAVMKQLARSGLSRFVKRIRETRYGLDIEFHDGQSALFQLLKHHGLSPEHHIVEWRAGFVDAIQRGEVDYNSLVEVLDDESLAADLFRQAGVPVQTG